MTKTIPGVLFFWFLAFLSQGCTGSGSDIGPHASSRAKSFLRGLVEDGRGDPIVSALVRLESGGETVTGRAGRFLLPYPKPGLHVLEVDGRNATADGSDRFGRLRFQVLVLGGPWDLDHRVVLPDLEEGASARVPLGTLSSQVDLDGGAAVLTLPAGTNVSLAGASGEVSLGLGILQEADLPVSLPSTGDLFLSGKAVFLDPPLARFEPSATLSVENTLGLSSGSEVLLYRLDPSTGAWAEVGKGQVTGTGARIEATQGINGGGVYLFAVSFPATTGTYVTGLVKSLEGHLLAGALVQGPEGRSARVLADGSFQLGPLVPVDGAGLPRSVTLVFRTGGGWTPAGTAHTLTLNPSGDTGAGTLVLDTVPAATLAVVGVYRGRPLPFKKVTGGTGDMVLSGRLDRDGRLSWEDVPLGKAEARTSWISTRKWYRGGTQKDLTARDGWFEARVLSAEGNSRPDNVDRTIAVRTVAAGGGGPLPGTSLFLGDGPDPWARGVTDYEAFHSFYGVRGPQKITAYRLFERGGKKLRSVVTFDGVDNSFFDLPLQVLSRSAGSPYEPFGVVQGVLTGGGGGTLGMTGRPRLDEWDLREAFLEGTDPGASYPLLEGPPSFRAGLPRLGSLTAWEVDPSSGALVRVGLLPGLPVEPGRVLPRKEELPGEEFHEKVLKNVAKFMVKNIMN